jgi:hypothetical protein
MSRRWDFSDEPHPTSLYAWLLKGLLGSARPAATPALACLVVGGTGRYLNHTAVRSVRALHASVRRDRPA